MYKNLLARGGLSLDRLHTLLQLEQHGSIAKAAPDSPTRQTLYSRQLKELSECFGVQLVRRQGRELKLTAVGGELARIARETFGSLTDFERRCVNQPFSVVVGGGDSVLQWLLLPSLGVVQSQVSSAQFSLRNLRTDDIVEGLLDATLDVGLLREDAVPPTLKRARLLKLHYAILAPRGQLSKGEQSDWRQVLENVPLIGPNQGGQWTRRLSQLAERDKLRLNFRAMCESFPQACRAVLSGAYAAILPAIAQVDLDERRFLRVDWPALRSESRNIAIAWNPRTLRIRPGLQNVVERVREQLTR
jgi:DNA-binding transcriptional LysR family regulator